MVGAVAWLAGVRGACSLVSCVEDVANYLIRGVIHGYLGGIGDIPKDDAADPVATVWSASEMVCTRKTLFQQTRNN